MFLRGEIEERRGGGAALRRAGGQSSGEAVSLLRNVGCSGGMLEGSGMRWCVRARLQYPPYPVWRRWRNLLQADRAVFFVCHRAPAHQITLRENTFDYAL